MSKIGGWLDRGGCIFGEGVCRMSRALNWNGAQEREGYCIGGFGLLEHRQREDEPRPCVFETENGRAVLVMDGTVMGGNSAVVAAYKKAGGSLADCLEGSFALALFDEGRGQILLSRSADGACPLYYRESDYCLCFSSEIKGILALNPQAEQVERTRLLAYLRAPCHELLPEFLYSGVYEFPKGRTAVYHRLGTWTAEHSVQPKEEEGKVPMIERASPPDRASLFRNLYEELMVHDAPYFSMPPWKGKALKQAEAELRSLLSECDPAWLRYCLGETYPSLIDGEKDAAARVRRLAMILQTDLWSRWVQVV